MLGAAAADRLHLKAFSGFGTSGLETFALKLYGEWQGRGTVPDGPPLAPLGPYEQLLASWRSDDPGSLVSGVIAAANYHVARSREHTNDVTFEFADEFFQLYPAEILAVYRLREQAGLANPEVGHPLFATPLGRLQPIVPPKSDPLLDGVLRRAKEQLPTLQ